MCRCVCGKEKIVCGDSLRYGDTKSCGCINKADKIERAMSVGKNNRKQNRWEYDAELNCMVGYTAKNKKFYVDIEDYERVNKYCWSMNGKYLISTRCKKETGFYFLHDLIMEQKGIDHANGNGTEHDNRKSNLRKCNQSENNYNQKIRKDNTSGVKGISWSEKEKSWVARIQKQGESHRKAFHVRDYNFDKNAALNEASKWINQERVLLHGTFANNGKMEDN